MEIVFDKVSLVINKGTPLEKTILNDVSFNISKEGIYSFVGASNSGKTGIADIINALMSPTSGSAKIGNFVNDGKRIKEVNKLRLETGYVYKNPYEMFFNKTVKDELEYAMKYYTKMTKRTTMRILDALTIVGLDESYDVDISTSATPKEIKEIKNRINNLLTVHPVLKTRIVDIDGIPYGVTDSKVNIETISKDIKEAF